jgi:hypothetical protein
MLGYFVQKSATRALEDRVAGGKARNEERVASGAEGGAQIKIAMKKAYGRSRVGPPVTVVVLSFRKEKIKKVQR